MPVYKFRQTRPNPYPTDGSWIVTTAPTYGDAVQSWHMHGVPSSYRLVQRNGDLQITATVDLVEVVDEHGDSIISRVFLSPLRRHSGVLSGNMLQKERDMIERVAAKLGLEISRLFEAGWEGESDKWE